jgi:HTH-type transcriptional regulator / antitoxin HipB
VFIRSPKELALLVINQRKKLKLSQTGVSNLVGLKQKTISGFENNPGSTKLETLFRILSALNLDIEIVPKDDAPSKTRWKEEW